MKPYSCLALVALSALTAIAAEPVSLHPENPHYFLFRKWPTVIVTSGEHYGAVLNQDFDFKKYLTTLKQDHLNCTRTFSGAYCEAPGAFNILSNTLAPLPGKLITPWVRSKVPGYPNGGNKFDLEKWDGAYFKRLKNFVSAASRQGVIVEFTLFCPFYEDSMWELSPMNAVNNVNGVGNVARTNVYTLDQNGGLLPFQEAMVRKIVRELSGFDNVMYEICNEPYFGGVTLDWQHRIADVIVDAEKEMRGRHLITQNIANDKAKVENPHPAVSVLNFHYATPPDTVAMNYDLNRVIGDNETGFRGTNNTPYRMEAWDFIVAGGGLFNHLDYSFVAGREDGTFVYPPTQPGGGNPELRKQFGFLSKTIHELKFVRMRPDNEVARADLPQGASLRALAEPGAQYLIYLRTGIGADKDKNLKTSFPIAEFSIEVNLPAGQYIADWLSPEYTSLLHEERLTHDGGWRRFTAPAFRDDIGLQIRKK
jgi:hypothetical protein